jgi:hypothetical protein
MQAAAGCAAHRMDGILGGRSGHVQTSSTWSYQFFEAGLKGAVDRGEKLNPNKGL